MIKQLFTKRSQNLDFYYPEKVNSLTDAMHLLMEELMFYVRHTLVAHDTEYYKYEDININLKWKSDNLGGKYTYVWVEADITAEVKELNE